MTNQTKEQISSLEKNVEILLSQEKEEGIVPQVGMQTKEVIQNIVENRLTVHYPKELPITEKVTEIAHFLARSCEEELLEKIRNGEAEGSDIERMHQLQSTIVVGETGSGKTTQIPKIVYETTRALSGKIICTQPRRIAAVTVAKRISEECHTRHGEEVGHKVRFDDSTSKEGTEIKVCTDGMLLQEMKHDPLLSKICAVVVDEAHERSLNIDFLIGLLKDIQVKRVKAGMDPLKITITSATIDAEKFSSYFGLCPVVNVSGRTHEVDIRHESTDNIQKSIVEHIKTIASEPEEGDVLVFLDGEERITRMEEQLKQEQIETIEVLPLHGRLPMQDQERVFKKMKKRKVILATNVAETSLTIPGIVYVIDSGLAKLYEFDTKTGVGSLLPRKISQASAKQRAGRAGRVRAGVCIRLYSEEDFSQRPPFTKPEIQRTDLSSVILHMKTTGIENPEDFNFIDPPERKAFHNAYVTLKDLGAIDDTNAITPLGLRLSRLPLEPRIGKMIVAAEKYGCLEDTLTIAAMLSVRDPFLRPKEKQYEADEAKKKFTHPDSDFLTLLSVWDAWRKLRHDGDKYRFSRENYLSFQSMEEIEKVRTQIVHSLPVEERLKQSAPSARDKDALAKAIASGLIQNLFRKDGRFSYESSQQSNVYLHPSSALFSSKPDWIVSSRILQTGKTFATGNTRIDPEWMEEIAPQLCTSSYESIQFNSTEGKMMCMEELSFKGMTLVRRRIDAADYNKEEASTKFMIYLTKYPHEFSFDFLKANQRLMKELEALHLRSLGHVPRVKDTTLQKLYVDHLYGCTSVESIENFIQAHGQDALYLKKEEYLTPEQEAQLEKDFPLHGELYGKKIAIAYPTSFSDLVPTLILDEELITKLNTYDTLGIVPGYDGAPYLRIILDSGKELSEKTVEELQYRYDDYKKQTIFDGMSEQFKAIESKEFTSLEELEHSFPTMPLEYSIGVTPISKESIHIYIVPRLRYGDINACVCRSREEALRYAKAALQQFVETEVQKRKHDAVDDLCTIRSGSYASGFVSIHSSMIRNAIDKVEVPLLQEDFEIRATVFGEVYALLASYSTEIDHLKQQLTWFLREGYEICARAVEIQREVQSFEKEKTEDEELACAAFREYLEQIERTISVSFSSQLSVIIEDVKRLDEQISSMEELMVQMKQRQNETMRKEHKVYKKLHELLEKKRTGQQKIDSLKKHMERYDPRLHRKQRQEAWTKVISAEGEYAVLKEQERSMVLKHVAAGESDMVFEGLRDMFVEGDVTALEVLIAQYVETQPALRLVLRELLLKKERKNTTPGILFVLQAALWEKVKPLLTTAQWSTLLSAMLEETVSEMDELLLLQRWDEVQG